MNRRAQAGDRIRCLMGTYSRNGGDYDLDLAGVDGVVIRSTDRDAVMFQPDDESKRNARSDGWWLANENLLLLSFNEYEVSWE